ncbi:sensor histidine kinase [Paenibacillus thermoaerophilus]|uniref:Sensor histidine kinase n=1 Tax=Paenibacillus thermoaerophilus TaxID=1215385 RepID=A0ABW2V415_9BACL|nr:GHKL domain-containing protein [Paenibacillus thermoaerophilus]TMV14348.1 GHKL domain-containing protein [Paenibacillus thermoaerophilus]
MWGKWKRRARELEQEKRLLLEQQAQMEKLIVEMRAERHEFVRRLQAVEHWLRSPEPEASGTPGGSRADLRRYLEESAADLQRMNEVLRGERGHTASLLEHLTDRAAAAGIRLKLALEAPLAALPVPMIDQTKLAGNLLENALEAASRFAAARGPDAAFIEVSASRSSGLYVLETKNSSLAIPGEVLDSLFRKPVASAKTGGDPDWRHGIGAYVVAQTVRKHGGRLDFTFQSQVFSVKIKLPVLSGQPG